MNYFPTLLKFDNKKVLIIGGGKVATAKLKHLLDFTTNITIISPTILPDMMAIINKKSLSFINRSYIKDDIKDFDIIIAALNDIHLQKEIFKESRKYNSLYNCVDIKECCDFIFPSYIKKGDLTIAISTNGTSPALSKYLKIYFDKIIPNSIIKFLEEMKQYRNEIPKSKKRMRFLRLKAKQYFILLGLSK